MVLDQFEDRVGQHLRLLRGEHTALDTVDDRIGYATGIGCNDRQPSRQRLHHRNGEPLEQRCQRKDVGGRQDAQRIVAIPEQLEPVAEAELVVPSADL